MEPFFYLAGLALDLHLLLLLLIAKAISLRSLEVAVERRGRTELTARD